MKRSMTVLMLGAILISACSLPTIKTSWSKPGAQPGEFEKAQAACEDDQGIAGLRGDAGFDSCMKQQGWFLIEEATQ